MSSTHSLRFDCVYSAPLPWRPFPLPSSSSTFLPPPKHSPVIPSSLGPPRNPSCPSPLAVEVLGSDFGCQRLNLFCFAFYLFVCLLLGLWFDCCSSGLIRSGWSTSWSCGNSGRAPAVVAAAGVRHFVGSLSKGEGLRFAIVSGVFWVFELVKFEISCRKLFSVWQKVVCMLLDFYLLKRVFFFFHLRFAV